VIGAQKAGTTTLRELLGQHPDIHCAAETHYFCDHYDRGQAWYTEQLSAGNDKSLTGEKCPHYLSTPEAIDRIADTIPGARLVAVLRNPVDRAYSHYWHQRRLAKETLPFADAIAAEDRRIADGVLAFDYVSRGRYLAQLEYVCERFPRSSLDVVLFEDLRANPQAVFDHVVAFIGARPGTVLVEQERVANAYREYRYPWLRNTMYRWRLWRRLPGPVSRAIWRATERPAEYEKLAPDLRHQLDETFAEDNARLAGWLGVDLTKWGWRVAPTP
jgi:hypothetical protein